VEGVVLFVLLLAGFKGGEGGEVEGERHVFADYA
jgi:hypothetical protein